MKIMGLLDDHDPLPRSMGEMVPREQKKSEPVRDRYAPVLPKGIVVGPDGKWGFDPAKSGKPPATKAKEQSRAVAERSAFKVGDTVQRKAGWCGDSYKSDFDGFPAEVVEISGNCLRVEWVTPDGVHRQWQAESSTCELVKCYGGGRGGGKAAESWTCHVTGKTFTKGQFVRRTYRDAPDEPVEVLYCLLEGDGLLGVYYKSNVVPGYIGWDWPQDLEPVEEVPAKVNAERAWLPMDCVPTEEGVYEIGGHGESKPHYSLFKDGEWRSTCGSLAMAAYQRDRSRECYDETEPRVWRPL